MLQRLLYEKERLYLYLLDDDKFIFIYFIFFHNLIKFSRNAWEKLNPELDGIKAQISEISIQNSIAGVLNLINFII